MLSYITIGLLMNKSKPILFYDAGCKFCSSTKSVLSRFDSRNVSFSPLTTQQIYKFQYHLQLSKSVSENVMYYKNKNGVVSFGSFAFFEYLKDKNGLAYYLGLLGDFSPIKWFAKQFYYCIANHRYFISKFL